MILGRKQDSYNPDISIIDKSRNLEMPASLNVKKRELQNRTFQSVLEGPVDRPKLDVLMPPSQQGAREFRPHSVQKDPFKSAVTTPIFSDT